MWGRENSAIRRIGRAVGPYGYLLQKVARVGGKSQEQPGVDGGFPGNLGA